MRLARAKEDVLFFLIVVPLFLVLILLSFLFLMRESRYNKQVLEYETSRLASDLLELIDRSRGGDLGKVRPDVLGFGVYGPEGAAFRYGTAPERIPSWERENQRLAFFFRDKRLVLIRALGFPMMQGRGLGLGRGMNRGMMRETKPRDQAQPLAQPELGPPPERFLYLEIDINEWQARQRPLQISFIFLPLAFVGVLFGVSVLYRGNRRYRLREEQNRQLLRLGEAARTLTHEIKNPLGAIMIQTATLRKLLPPEYHKNLTVIGEETERLALLVDRVGDFLRNSKGDPVRIDLGPFIRDLLPRFSGPIVFGGGGDGVFVLFDPHRLRTVLENLVRNALESVEVKGPEKPAPEIEIRADKKRVEVLVLDRGLGLPEGAGEKLFDPFFTTKIKGSGIGLAVSKRFVEAMDGTLEVLPRTGGGAVARITLAREVGT